MAISPIQYFRKEDFPELIHEPWAQRLFQKLNAFARQTQSDLNREITIGENIAAYWWDGNIHCKAEADGVFYPFRVPATIPTLTVANKTASCIPAFPFTIEHKMHPKKVAAIIAVQAFDISIAQNKPTPAMPAGVAWTQEGKEIRISAINGLITSATANIARMYKLRLLVLCE